MKETTILGISIGAILSLSLVSFGVIPQVLADNDKDFTDLHFKSAPCRIADPSNKVLVEESLGIKVNGDGSLKGADCSVKAWFDDEGQSLKYQVHIRGMESIDKDGNPDNDIGKMHFHRATMFVNDDPNNPAGPRHILNIFKLPAQDDNDLKYNKGGIFQGIWDESDTMDRDGENDDTYNITDELTQEILCNGEAFLMVHGNTDGLPGFIKASIQPTEDGEAFCEELLS